MIFDYETYRISKKGLGLIPGYRMNTRVSRVSQVWATCMGKFSAPVLMPEFFRLLHNP